ncbi:2Fe-2S iron-sulfur cluster binding domain-containing protein (plasmid) [Mesorhizobium sp. NBSH29]|uniref:(2Fe-2S)-binding protein n=1 Tax=Mesorhizobium sp. NBSH29 TaxID=2654249 RepID=UPI001896756A|nr:(2Fe-2S)-binding protein [Mesorhizobium sp. NBSH29]QPC88830.1 2Fe-2S iron-sulfur cluster binding domain-containing protein [Mesorhizobium sp. NBSH29]
MTEISMTVNGNSVGPIDVPEDLMMLEFLNEYLNLTGTRYGCGQGVCRACAVLVDMADGARTMAACVTGAIWFDGRSVRTVEGHATRDAQGQIAQLSPVQQAFLDHFSFQCSYCTPGFVNEATALVERLARAPIARADVEATVLEALNGNICRCTGYVRYLGATRDLILETPGLTLTEDGA